MLRLAFAVAAFAACLIAWPALADPPPAEDYGRLPAATDAAISPDGTKVALASFDNGRPHVRVLDLVRRGIMYDGALDAEGRLESVGWIDDTHVSLRVKWTLSPGAALPDGYRFTGTPGRVDY